MRAGIPNKLARSKVAFALCTATTSPLFGPRSDRERQSSYVFNALRVDNDRVVRAVGQHNSVNALCCILCTRDVCATNNERKNVTRSQHAKNRCKQRVFSSSAVLRARRASTRCNGNA